jgi:hypothetical protein
VTPWCRSKTRFSVAAPMSLAHKQVLASCSSFVQWAVESGCGHDKARRMWNSLPHRERKHFPEDKDRFALIAKDFFNFLFKA